MNHRSLQVFVSLAGLAGLSLSASAGETVDFGSEVYPILRESCLSCHAAPYEDMRGRTKQPKGGLRLDTPDWIMKGYENDEGEMEAVVVPGDAEASEFYTLTTLPEDHDEVMPARGDLLAKEQIEILKRWVNEGAKFGEFKAPAYLNPKSKQAVQ